MPDNILFNALNLTKQKQMHAPCASEIMFLISIYFIFRRLIPLQLFSELLATNKVFSAWFLSKQQLSS